ncbi:hypothetical protein COO60DRAFT_1636923 [Scenedesmus sp. NREL 46B-D3]|nr:hypothetical protein COO60DRAFT_1636923 [Scenedesmus sp. NREL 46B-D3]
MHGLPAASGGGHGAAEGAEQQLGSAGGSGSEPIGIKQFTASSKKQLTSKFRGVCWNKKNKRWQAAINSGGKYIYLGSFTGENDAARQFDRAAIKIRGKKAKLNFPASDYVDEKGNLLEDFELPPPAGSGKAATAGGSSTKSAAPKAPPSSSRPSPQQQQQQQQQQLDIKPVTVDGRMMQQFSFGGQQTTAGAADGGWQHRMLMQQQQRHGQFWPQQQQQQEQEQKPPQLLWQEKQQVLQQGQLLNAHTWNEPLLAPQSQQVHAQQQAAAAGGNFTSQLAENESLPPNTAVGDGASAAAAADGGIAVQVAPPPAQRSCGQQMIADGCSSGALHIPGGGDGGGQAGSCFQDCQACQPGSMYPISLPDAAAAGSLRQAGVTVTTSMGFSGNTSDAGRFAAAGGRLSFVEMMQDVQQHQLLVPELTVAELDLPQLAPFMTSSSTAGGTAALMQQQPLLRMPPPQQLLSMQQQQHTQQLLSTPSYGMQPTQPQHQQGASWQQQQQGVSWQQQQQQQQQAAMRQQQQPLHAPSSIGCPGVLDSFNSTASAAQQYTQQVCMGAAAVGSSSPSMTAPPPPPAAAAAHAVVSGSSLGSGGSAHANGMCAAMQSPAPHHAVQHTMTPAGPPGTQLARQMSGVGHAPAPAPAAAPAITHALSARMASCEFGEALQLARQAAAAQGVTDLTGALRQMSSAQLPVVTTASGAGLAAPQQLLAAAGTPPNHGLLQRQGSGVPAGVSSMDAGAPLAMQPPAQPVIRQISAEHAAAAEAVGSSCSAPTKHALTQGCTAVAAEGDGAAAPASKRARTNSMQDDATA